jgi:hypothetical protein
MPVQSRVLPLIEMFRDLLPGWLQGADRLVTDQARTARWLVGLSGSALALVVANPTYIQILNSQQRKSVIAALIAAVVFGVLHLLLKQLATSIRYNLALRLHSYLAGYLVGVNMKPLPSELDPSWDRGEIITRFRSEFDLDYSMLERFDVPLDRCQEAYRSIRSMWISWDSEDLQKFGEIVAAHSGHGKRWGAELFTKRESLSMTRVRGFLTQGLFVASGLLLWLSSLAFILAATVAGLAAIKFQWPGR